MLSVSNALISREVVFRGHVIEEIVRVVRARLPREAIGLLAADGDDVVTAIYALDGDATPDRVRVSSQQRDVGMQALACRGLRVIGTFHSHPTGRAVPSDGDVRTLEAGEVMLIVGLIGGREDLRLWTLDDTHRRAIEIPWRAKTASS